MGKLLFLALIAIGLGCCSASSALAEQPAEAHDEHAAADHAHHELGHGDAGANLLSPAELRGDLAIYTFVVFLLLLAILSWLAWPKISAALLEREKRIEASLAAAEAKHEEAKRLLAQHEAQLATAAGEVRAMLEEARRDADAAKAEIVSEAKAAAQQERQRALRDIDIAKDHAMKDIAETSANLAVELAGKVIRETIKPEKTHEIVREALRRLGDSAVSRN
jgi:F-type H+-transporting ATPase subunit b